MKLSVYVLWGPIRPQDNKGAALEATQYLRDARAAHFWDSWKFSVDHYTRQLRYPPGRDAWDLFVVYRPGQNWGESLPPPAAWFQNHNLDVGPKYDQQALEQAILQAAAE